MIKNKTANLSEVTITVILILLVIIIGLSLFFVKANEFKSFLGF